MGKRWNENDLFSIRDHAVIVNQSTSINKISIPFFQSYSVFIEFWSWGWAKAPFSLYMGWPQTYDN